MAFGADEPKLQTLAKSANTPAEHAVVAKAYSEWAAELDAKAKKHEAEAEKLANSPNYNPMRHKWPAMVQGPIDREKRLAMAARRAANEARETAAKHSSLSGGKVAADDE